MAEESAARQKAIDDALAAAAAKAAEVAAKQAAAEAAAREFAAKQAEIQKEIDAKIAAQAAAQRIADEKANAAATAAAAAAAATASIASFVDEANSKNRTADASQEAAANAKTLYENSLKSGGLRAGNLIEDENIPELEILSDSEFLKTNIPGTNLTTAELDRKSTRLNSSHSQQSRMPSSA